MRVLKWDVPVDGQEHPIGNGRVLHTACQHSPDVVQVWTEEHGDGKPGRTAQAFGTGQPIAARRKHIGSAVTAGGSLVWHVYVEEV